MRSGAARSARCWTPWPASTTAASRREPARLRRPGGDRPAAAADPAGRARDRLDRGRHRARSCAGSAPPRATPACSTRSRASRSTCSACTASRACAGRRARSSPPATARSAARPSTAPSGSRTSSAPDHFKLPATRALALAGVALDVPEIDVPVHAPIPDGHTWREISYDRARRRRPPALRLLQRRDEHRPVPPAARRLPLRAQPAADQRDRPRGRRRLLLQRDPPQRDRGGARARRGVVVEPARDRRRRARGRWRPTRTW